MASERSKRRDLLTCIFITKSISKKLLIRKNRLLIKIEIVPAIRGLLNVNIYS